MKKDEASIGKTKTGVMVYLYAKNIDEQIEVRMLLRYLPQPLSPIDWLAEMWVGWFQQKIKKGNGKLVGDKRKEGEHGMIQEFEDTEGNWCATYAMVNKQACPQQEDQKV